MKKLSLVILLLAVIAVNAQNGGKIFPYDYKTTKLDNGLSVILIPMESPGLVAYFSVVRTGSRDEWEPGKSGFAHFFEHMMFRGTEKYPGPVYDSIITSIGADANAYTDDDLTVYHLNFAAEDLPKVMELESDRFQNLKYTKEQFQTESGAIYGEYRKSVTSPFMLAIEKLHDISFTTHTYKHTTIGFEEDIKNMPNIYDYSLTFYQRYYRPENVVLLIAGDIDAGKTLDMVKKYYGDWKPGYVKPQIQPEPEQKSPNYAKVEFPGKTLPIMVFGFKNEAFNVDNKNFLASVLLSDIAFGETSDLYNKLVLQEQKVQFLAADPGMRRDPGLFYIYTMVKNPADTAYVKEQILQTLEHFKNNPVDEKRLNDLKKRSRYSFLMNLNTPDNTASALPYYITITGGIEVIDNYFTKMNNIKPEDIMDAAKKYFKPERRNLVTVIGEQN